MLLFSHSKQLAALICHICSCAECHDRDQCVAINCFSLIESLPVCCLALALSESRQSIPHPHVTVSVAEQFIVVSGVLPPHSPLPPQSMPTVQLFTFAPSVFACASIYSLLFLFPFYNSEPAVKILMCFYFSSMFIYLYHYLAPIRI